MFTVGKSVTLDHKGKSMKSSLKGWKTQKGGYLLVEPPSPANCKLLTKPRETVIVRMKIEGTIYGFVTGSAKLLRKTNLLRLELKEEIMQHSIRSEDRYPCFIPAEIVEEQTFSLTEPIKNDGMICDISLLGAMFLSPEPLKSEGSVRLTFSLGSEGTITGVSLKILRSRMVKEKYMYAGAFLGLHREDREKLGNFFNFFKQWNIR